jgi:hypothetical protein
MWPSEELASRLYDLANWGLIAGLVLGVGSTVFLVWMGNVKEEYLRRGLAATTERVAAANERAGKAEEEAGKANERAAQANEAAERERLARIKIEEQLGGWKLAKNAQDRVVNALKPFAGTHFSLYANPVEQSFVTMIDRILTNSGWVRDTPVDENGNPSTVLLDNKASVTFSAGLSVMVSHDQFAELSPAAAAYKQALIAEGLDVKLIEALAPASKIAPTVLKIRIGRRE